MRNIFLKFNFPRGYSSNFFSKIFSILQTAFSKFIIQITFGVSSISQIDIYSQFLKFAFLKKYNRSNSLFGNSFNTSNCFCYFLNSKNLPTFKFEKYNNLRNYNNLENISFLERYLK